MSEQIDIKTEILKFIDADPFVPFVIVMASGDRYLIEDPDALAIAKSQLHYYPPRSSNAVHMRINQISSVEELEERPAA